MDAANNPLDESARTTLMALADVLIPADKKMPAASEADADGQWLDRVLSVRPDLLPVLTRTLSACTGADPAAEVARLRTEDPEGFLALATTVAGAYYLNPAVVRRYGFPVREPSLAAPDEVSHDLRDGILDDVIRRGPIFRPTPMERHPGK